MPLDSPLEERQPLSEHNVQPYVVQQVPVPFQNADLLSLDAAEDEIPPPAYGDVYGEIHSEKDGLGTSARVTDDGRVNIRINQLNRRLSQIFNPALRQESQDAQEASIPVSLPGEKGTPPPPRLNVVIQVVGSRGDVQPFVAFGQVLKDTYGHRVRLATHPNFKDLVESNGLEFFSIGGDPSKLMAFMAKNPGLMPGIRSLMDGDVSQRRKEIGEYIQGCWRSCYEAGDGLNNTNFELEARPFVADCIIANPPSFAHIHCAEKLGIPLHIMFTMPYSPTQSFPHPLANIQSSNADPQLTNFISYAMIELLVWQGIGDIINRFRKKCLSLEPISTTSATSMLQRLKVPYTYCWSPALIPKPNDWGPQISISGFYFLKSSEYTPAPELQAFLDAGPTPIYIGFGSIVLEDPDALTKLIFDAVRTTGQRVLLSQGWGGIGAASVPDGVFMLGEVPHDWLFKQVSCVVHHGGAGTTAIGLKCAKPTVVVPFFGDQHFWGSVVARAGAGPSPIPIKQLNADKLADAIKFCLRPESQDRARELATKIVADSERGSDKGAQCFHDHLDTNHLRCHLVPSRAAVWRIKRTKIRLSAFAACTLANAGLLDFQDLKLYRPQEYQTDEGPWDPLSGGFAAVLRSFGGMAMGLADVPGETYKAVRISSRQQSQASASTKAIKRKPVGVSNTSAPPVISPAQSQTSLDKQDSSARSKSPSVLSVPSSSASRTRPNRDMLRRTGVHTSKGFGRMLQAAFSAPMDISVGLQKGFHNAPKIWGDDTVRQAENVTDLKSGMKAVGREFGFGMYDGITGLAMQPWNGARKEGVVGFAKGFGKGIGGFVAKPSAALCGVLGHSMKGVQKEVQKLFAGDVRNYIGASRASQGYEEWLQSSEADREEVMERWRSVQECSKEKSNPDEMMWMKLDASRNGDEHLASHAQSNESTSTSIQDETNEAVRSSHHKMEYGEADEDGDVLQAIRENVSQLQRRRQTAVGQDEAQTHLQQEDEKHMPQSRLNRLSGQESSSAESQLESDIGLDSEDEERFEHARRQSKEAAPAESGNPQKLYPNDSGHLSGTTQADFEAQQQREKSMQERTEEEVVLEYVKKQSLLEAQHRIKGKRRAIDDMAEDEDDEELQEALNMSLQEHGGHSG